VKVISHLKNQGQRVFFTDPYFVVEYEEQETISGNVDEEVTLVKMIVQEVAITHKPFLVQTIKF
jgi:ATP-dependent Lon protease